MRCDSILDKEFSKKCILCGKIIGLEDFNYTTTRTSSNTSSKKLPRKSFKGKTIYVHNKCYNKEYNMNLPVHI